MLHWLTEQVSGSPLSYLIVLLSAGGDVLFPVIPSETVVITAGIVSAHGRLLLPLVIGAAILGALVGDNLVYLGGAKLGEPLTRRLFRGEQATGRLEWAQRALRGHGSVVIVVGRFIPGGRTASTFAAGTLGLPWRRFILADVVAATLWALYATSLGYFGGQAFRDSVWLPLGAALAVAGVATGLIELWRRRQRRRGRDLLGDRVEGDGGSSRQRPVQSSR